MTFELEMTVCGESQGVNVGESFAACVADLFSMIHNVPEQFTQDYITAALNCLYYISQKIDNDDCFDLSFEMDGEIVGLAMAGYDAIVLTFRQSAE
jgi:hypothetical protein